MAFAILIIGAKITVAIEASTPIAMFVIFALRVISVFGISYLKWLCPRCKKSFISRRAMGLIYRNPLRGDAYIVDFLLGHAPRPE